MDITERSKLVSVSFSTERFLEFEQTQSIIKLLNLLVCFFIATPNLMGQSMKLKQCMLQNSNLLQHACNYTG